MKKVSIYDSKAKKKLDFIPIKEDEVRIYVCGPTVYDDAHLGHARSSLVFDLLARVFRSVGYRVTLAKNFTDIDDKIIQKAKLSHQSLKQIATTYIHSYLKDMEALGIRRADIEPKATQSLKPITEMIQTLLQKGIAYQNDNLDVYLEVAKDAQYGSLSQRGNDEDSQARIQNDEEKRDSRDFSLWKAYKGEEDVGYESTLGLGRPGWHIECSAMIEAHLAYPNEDYAIDIHGGGADLLFPHHENEASQTRCATGRELAKYWMHNGFVNINGEKMSKSLGNSFFIKDALNLYDGEILRNYLISTHYRAILGFNEEDLLASKKRLDKIYRLKKRINFQEKSLAEDLAPSNDFQNELLESLCDDLNISKALAIVESMLNTSNQKLDSTPKDAKLKEEIRGNLEFISSLLGIGRMEAKEYFQLGIDAKSKEEIEKALQERLEAKKSKDYAKADAIRSRLESMGILILDTPEGSSWEKVQ